MTYTFKYTERNLGKGSEYETRALIYLISLSQHRNDVHYIFIDCFNDISGTSQNCDEIFDIQSKGVKNLTPKKIGISLITLFENFLSSLKFTSSILFLETIDEKYLEDKSITNFDINNFGKNKSKVSAGLKQEFLKRNKIDSDRLIDISINKFLDSVKFVVDTRTKVEYVKSLTKFKNEGIKDSAFFESVFKEIQDIQIAKKTILIEAKQVKNIKETLNFKKHLNSKDIHTLVVNRIIGVDLFRNLNIPIHFMNETRELNIEEVRDLIQKCYSQVSRALFDKNSHKGFWAFLEVALVKVEASPQETSQEIYHKIAQKEGVHSRYLEGLPGVFLISLIKEGFE